MNETDQLKKLMEAMDPYQPINEYDEDQEWDFDFDSEYITVFKNGEEAMAMPIGDFDKMLQAYKYAQSKRD